LNRNVHLGAATCENTPLSDRRQHRISTARTSQNRTQRLRGQRIAPWGRTASRGTARWRLQIPATPSSAMSHQSSLFGERDPSSTGRATAVFVSPVMPDGRVIRTPSQPDAESAERDGVPTAGRWRAGASPISSRPPDTSSNPARTGSADPARSRKRGGHCGKFGHQVGPNAVRPRHISPLAHLRGRWLTGRVPVRRCSACQAHCRGGCDTPYGARTARIGLAHGQSSKRR
jgi:hypothetical protein